MNLSTIIIELKNPLIIHKLSSVSNQDNSSSVVKAFGVYIINVEAPCSNASKF